jgi:N-[(2S)-2-amino-2-carboxyethyl]-L-glutamate dehydrogenase
MPDLSLLTGENIAELLIGRETDVVEWVRQAYFAHDDHSTVNPDSYFLRFPHKPEARIIALPAYLGDRDLAGLKWIASFPGNVAEGLARASAILVLNDGATGFPFAVLEAAAISAARTAASAALAARTLAVRTPKTVGVVGGGVIARTICRYLAAIDVPLHSVSCHDIDAASARALCAHLDEYPGAEARTAGIDEVMEADLVVLATTAAEPYIDPELRLRPDQLVLNISLRDLPPELLMRSNNVLDDVEHCLKANTSPHLAELRTGSRDFVTGTLAGVIRGRETPDPSRATVFSPFGLGVLDLAVGHELYLIARGQDRLVEVPGFFGDVRRW